MEQICLNINVLEYNVFGCPLITQITGLTGGSQGQWFKEVHVRYV